jgi:hypothetical protein
MVRFKAAQQFANGTKTKKHEQENVKAVHSLWEKDIKTPTIKLDHLDDNLDDSAGSGN